MRTKLVMQLADELDEVNFERKQPVTQLDDIEPAFPALDLAYEGLIATEAVSQVGLTHALAQTCKLKLLQENWVSGFECVFGPTGPDRPALPKPDFAVASPAADTL